MQSDKLVINFGVHEIYEVVENSVWAARFVAGVLLSLSVVRVFASLIAYEGFEYTAGTTVGGLSGGTGWTNAWLGTSTATYIGTNTALGLNYTDANSNALQIFGGSVIVGNPVGTTATTATPNRLLPYNLSGGAGTTAGPGATT